MTNRAKLPGLPRVSTQDQALNRWITAVAERLEVREGSRGDPGERAVTVKELQTLTRNAVKVVGGELVASGALTGNTDPTADPNFVARLEEAIRNTRLYQNLVKRLDDPSRFDDLATEVRQALANSIAQEALSRGADIRRVETKIQQSDRSLAMAVEELTAAIGTSAAGIREVKSAFATADRAQAAKVTQLEARLDIPVADADKLPKPPAAPYASLAALKTAVPKGVTGKYYRVAGAKAGDPELLYAWNGKDYLLAGEGTNAKLEEVMKVTADRVTGAESEYTMKVEATTGGVTAVAGFGLSAAVDPSGQKTSAFIVRADKFAVVAPGDTSATDRFPFGVDANGVYINGTLRVNSGGKTAEELANDFYLTATGQVFTQNPNASTLTPASATLTAVRKGTIATSGTLTFASSPAGLLSVSGNTATIQSSAFATNSSVKVTATLTHNNVTYTDEFTLYKVTDGADALVGFLTNESHALPADAEGLVSSYAGASGEFVVFRGGAKLTSTTTPSVTYSKVSSDPTGLTATINASTGAYSVTGGMTADVATDVATVTFRATIGTQTIDKVFTLARQKAATPGESGDYVDYVFKRSTTPITTNTGIPTGWDDTPPAGEGALYMSTATKKFDGTLKGPWSIPVRLDGEPGKDGKYTEYQYALSSSATVAPTTGWQASPPAVTAEAPHLWMRSRLVAPPTPAPDWSNNTAVRISGESGADAGSVYLTASSQVFRVDKAGAASPANITLTAVGQNVAGIPAFTVTSGTATISGTGSTRTLSFTGLTTDTATIKVTWDGLEDTITVAKVREGADAITVVVPNDSHILQAGNDGAVSSYVGSGTTITVYEGSSALAASPTATTSAFRIGAITQSPPGTITPGAVAYSGTTATIADHQGMAKSTDSVVLTIPITVYRANGAVVSLSKQQTITKSKAGATGAGVQSVENSYLKSSSGTLVPNASDSNWNAAIPALDNVNKFLWNKEVITYKDGQKSTAIYLIAQKGEGGKGIASITEVYKVHTSGTSAPPANPTWPDPAWSSSIPAMTDTYPYLWSKETISYTDNSAATVLTKVIAQKGKDGSPGKDSTTPGPQGKRGTIVTKLDITVAQWDDAKGAAAIKAVAESNGATPDTPIKGDIVHLKDGGKECTAAGNPGTWGNVSAYFSGSLIAGGTVVAGVSFSSGGYFNGSGEGTGGTAKVKNTGTSETSVSYTGQFISSKTNGPSAGVIGKLASTSVVDGAGVYGEAASANTSGAGVVGCGYYGVVGKALSSATGSVGVYAEASVSGGTALLVSGPGKFTGKINSSGDIATTQNITAGLNITAYYSSDRRLKTNITPIPDALKKVSSLRGVTYDWTDAYIESQGGEDGYFIRRRDVGVIAQEVQAVLPEIVAERADGMLAVKYERLVSVLIEAVKELQARVEVLEAK